MPLECERLFEAQPLKRRNSRGSIPSGPVRTLHLFN